MRTDLRWGRIWLTLGWIAVAVAWVLNLIPGHYIHKIRLNDKFEHITGYVLLTLWFCGIYRPRRYWLVALAFCVMGALVEVLQGAMHWGRTEDIRDFYADVIGIVIGLLIAGIGMRHWPRWVEQLFKRA